MNIVKQYYGHIIGLLVVMIIITISALWTIPELQRYLAINESIELEEQRVSELLVPKRNVLLSTLPSEVELLVADARSAVPESAQPVYLLAFLEELGFISGVEVVDPIYVYSQVADEGVIVLSASIVGDHAGTVQFFTNIYNAVPVFRILQFSFHSELGKNTSQIILSSPFKPLPSSLGTVHTPIQPITDEERLLAQIISQRIRPGDTDTLLPEGE